MHELKKQGIPDSREVIAFNHVRAARRLTFARTYLKDAGLAALPKRFARLLGTGPCKTSAAASPKPPWQR